MIKVIPTICLFMSLFFIASDNACAQRVTDYENDLKSKYSDLLETNVTTYQKQPLLRKNNEFNESFPRISSENSFQQEPWENVDLNFPPNGIGLAAGDINGDGLADLVRTYSSIPDMRIENLNVVENRSLIFYGGNNTINPDQQVDALLTPVGDINGDGFDDAIGQELSGTRYYYLGSENGYSQSLEMEDFTEDVINGFRDFDQDGFDDILLNDRVNPNGFSIFFGAAEIEDVMDTTYFTLGSRSVVPAFLGRNTILEIDDGSFNFNGVIIRIFSIVGDLKEMNLISIDTIDIASDLSSRIGNDFDFYPIDLDNDGFDEIYSSASNNVEAFGYVLETNTEGRFTELVVTSPVENFTMWIPVGDLNNQGAIDFIARGSSDNELLVAYGENALTNGLNVDLTLQLDTRITSIPSVNVTLRTQASYGDFNDDDIDDFQIGIINENGFGQRNIFGISDGVLDEFVDIIYENETFARLPNYLENANLGDINNDGVDELALLYTDRIDIHYGGNLNLEPDITIPSGEFINNEMTCGDFNGDGIIDIVVGLALDNNPVESSVVVNFYFGSATFDGEIDHSLTLSDIATDSLIDFERIFSSAINSTNIGDVNNDGVDDLLILGPNRTNGFIYFGQETISVNPNVVLGGFDTDFGLEDLNRNTFSLGFRAMGLEDINGDGIDDFAIADIGRVSIRNTGTNFILGIGIVMVYYGTEGDIDIPDVVLFQEDEFDDNLRLFGLNMIAGDYNGDGNNDLLVTPLGLRDNSNLENPQDGGKSVFIYHGGTGFDNVADMNFALPAAPFGIQGINNVNSLIGEFITVPDLNGDGADEFIFGSFTDQNAILVLGGDELVVGNIPAALLEGPNNLADLTHRNNDVIVSRSGSIGDFNGDGILEVVLPQQSDLTYRNIPVYTFPLQNPLLTNQNITFPLIEDRSFSNESFELNATTSSGLPVEYSVLSGPAAVTGSDVTLTGIGEVTIEASQVGNDSFNPAPLVRRTFNVTVGDQVITFEELPDVLANSNEITLIASSDSGLEVAFALVDGPATLEGNKVTITGAGEITIEASQVGNELFNPAPSVRQTFSAVKIDQTITFEELPDVLANSDEITLVASSDSGLEVAFALVDGPATLEGNRVTITGAGEITIEVSQVGNELFNPAPSVRQTFSAVKVDQTITFEELPNVLADNEVITLVATSDSGLDITFDLVEGPAAIEGDQLTLLGEPGTIVLRAIQSGDDIYNSAEPIERSFEVMSVTAISDLQSLEGFSIYPNPLEDQLTINLGPLARRNILNISFYTMSGSLVSSDSNVEKFAEKEIKLDIRFLQKGVYLLVIETTEQSFQVRLLK